ncbi:hypothetical protein, partial [Escherichia coli]|uniref:hypothetical protein n=1 Tax=Escherichia coli TaxID=562 RepID=UPI001A8CDBCD
LDIMPACAGNPLLKPVNCRAAWRPHPFQALGSKAASCMKQRAFYDYTLAIDFSTKKDASDNRIRTGL